MSPTCEKLREKWKKKKTWTNFDEMRFENYLWIPQVSAVIIQSRVHFDISILRPLVTGYFNKVGKLFFQSSPQNVGSNLNFFGHLRLSFNWHDFGIVMASTNVKGIRVYQFIPPLGCVVIVLGILRHTTKAKNSMYISLIFEIDNLIKMLLCYIFLPLLFLNLYPLIHLHSSLQFYSCDYHSIIWFCQGLRNWQWPCQMHQSAIILGD